MTAAAPDLAFPPELLGRFEVTQTLLAKPYRATFVARDTAAGDERLLTVFTGCSPEEASRIETRLGRVAGVTHPHLRLPVAHGRGRGGLVWTAEVLEDGENLSARIQRRPHPGRRDLVRWGAQAARALAALHAAGELHRDVRPAVIRLRDGGDAALTEVAFRRPETMPRVLSDRDLLPGSAPYMAPELWLGAAPDPASEQFALAAALYATRYRQPIYPAYSPEEILQLVKVGFAVEHLGSPGALAPGLERALARALSRDPSARWPDLAAFADALEEDSGHEPPPSSPDGAPSRVRPPGRTTSRIVLPKVAKARRQTRRVYLWVIGISALICLVCAVILGR